MKTLELFCGTKSFSKVAKELGHETFTIDNAPMFEPDLCIDIMGFNPKIDDSYPDILWASPPCQGFSVAAMGKNWGGGFRAYEPKTDSARLAMKLALRTLELIRIFKPRYWFIENPRAMLRKMPFMEDFLKETGGVRRTITYCQYGDTRMKPSDIFTNCIEWRPRPICKNGDPCHEAAPRGSKTGTQGLKGAKARGVIPSDLFYEIFKHIDESK
jgi:hypothetical protein